LVEKPVGIKNMGKFIVKAKHCRRLGENLTGQEKFRKILTKRNYPPGIHGQTGRIRISEYGEQLREKQRARYSYGLREKQLRKYFVQAQGTKTNTGEELVRLLERRLDNVIYRLGLSSTRAQARQLISHHHIKVNGRVMDVPSYSVRTGDKIELKDKSKELTLIKDGMGRHKSDSVPNWLVFEPKDFAAQVINLPQETDLDVGINTRLIIEYYSR
jgi:small subunit ribosomal protein S4